MRFTLIQDHGRRTLDLAHGTVGAQPVHSSHSSECQEHTGATGCSKEQPHAQVTLRSGRRLSPKSGVIDRAPVGHRGGLCWRLSAGYVAQSGARHLYHPLGHHRQAPCMVGAAHWHPNFKNFENFENFGGFDATDLRIAHCDYICVIQGSEQVVYT